MWGEGDFDVGGGGGNAACPHLNECRGYSFGVPPAESPAVLRADAPLARGAGSQIMRGGRHRQFAVL